MWVYEISVVGLMVISIGYIIVFLCEETLTKLAKFWTGFDTYVRFVTMLGVGCPDTT